MSVQGPLLRWVAVHRRHHVHSDGEGDPHSPHGHGGGIRGVIVGFWHAHLGWMFEAHHPDLARYVRDLNTDRLIRVASKLFIVWAIFLGFLWGGLVRIFLVHHATWSINSVCHLWGRQPFDGDDESRNNFICGILGFGEGWHNNHHSFPSSARHGLRWWQIDMSFMLIRLMERLGLAWNVRLPSPGSLDAKRL
jgi:stearoyl-CoA desaturase (delta-9 desaturase)